ncbi:MAG: hypothetical protein LC634_02870 [Sphingomonadales bacterium]|nr:hypothetical protein [Sphingomonadales bacterium]
MKLLESDPEFVAKRAARDEALRKRREELSADVAPVISDLNDLGISVKSLWQLVGSRPDQIRAIPVLLKHLPIPYLDANREWIARGLALREAIHAWPLLRAEYEKAPDESRFKDGLGDALATMCDADHIEEVVEMIMDEANGESRLMLLSALKRSKSPIARSTIEKLRNDLTFAAEIASWKTSRTRG